MQFLKPTTLSAYENAIRNSDHAYRRRSRFDRVHRWIRTCAVCTATLPPIDLVCDLCWEKLARLRNRGPQLLQKDYPFPVYSLFTWTKETAPFIRPFIYGFKRGHSVGAAKDLALEFLTERSELSRCETESYDSAFAMPTRRVFIPPPSNRFDHGDLWTKALADRCLSPVWPVLAQVAGAPSGQHQKQLGRADRSQRRFEIREQIAGSWPLGNESGRLIFADDVITTGSTAMAAYMALGDPDMFEVWTLVARPRVATS